MNKRSFTFVWVGPGSSRSPNAAKEACTAVPEDLRHPLREIAAACDIDADYLGCGCCARRIVGQQRRGRWYTSEAAVRRYQQEVAEGAVPVGRPRRHRVHDNDS